MYNEHFNDGDAALQKLTGKQVTSGLRDTEQKLCHKGDIGSLTAAQEFLGTTKQTDVTMESG